MSWSVHVGPDVHAEQGPAEHGPGPGQPLAPGPAPEQGLGPSDPPAGAHPAGGVQEGPGEALGRLLGAPQGQQLPGGH